VRGLTRLLRLVRPHRGKVALALLATNFASLSVLAIPLVVRFFLGAAISGSGAQVPLAFTLAVPGVLLLSAIGSYAAVYVMLDIAASVTADLRRDYVQRLLHLPLGFHRGRNIGELLDRLVASTADVEWCIRNVLVGFVTGGLHVLGALGLMCFLSWKLTLVSFLASCLGALGYALLHGRIRRAEKGRQEASAEVSAHVHDLVTGIEVVKAFQGEGRALTRFGRLQNALLESQRHGARLIALTEPVVVSVMILAVFSVLLFGSRLIAAGELTAGSLVAFLMYFFMALPQIRALSLLYARSQRLMAALERLDEIQAIAPEQSPPDARPLPRPVSGAIELRQVSYRYPNRELALRDVSLRIRSHERIGIVGESGAGKSTLCNLLLCFFEPQEGQILIDGAETRATTFASIREAVAFVPQDVVLFDDTILENVRYGRPTATDDEVLAACRTARADEFVRELPDGYTTRVGGRGLSLSGGQRQRLALARALLKDAPILLLDEPTSSLDAKTERSVDEAMGSAMKGRTTIVIAHRLATVVHLDRILVMRAGEVVEEGAHEELLERCALYRNLVASQLIGTAREPVA
jgi:ATP-binding cassette subfamily B protein